MPHGLLGAPGSPQEAQGTLGAPRAYGPRAPRTPRLSFKFTASEVPNVRVCFSFHHQCRPNDLGWVLVGLTMIVSPFTKFGMASWTFWEPRQQNSLVNEGHERQAAMKGKVPVIENESPYSFRIAI